MPTILWIILATLSLSAISLIGAFTLVFKESLLKKITVPLVAFSAGALIGGALLHLIPEAIEETGNIVAVMLWVIVGFTAFLIFEQILHWHHCHEGKCEVHPMSYLILVGDAIHNFINAIINWFRRINRRKT